MLSKKDRLVLTFKKQASLLAPQFEDSSGNMFQEDFSLQGSIPRQQVNDDFSQKLASAGAPAQAVLNTFMIGNLILNTMM